MQHDPRPGSADRVADGDSTAVDVEFVLAESAPGLAFELLAAIAGAVPGPQAAHHPGRQRPLISQRSGSLSPRPWRCRMGVAAWTGPRPIWAGSRPAHWLSTILGQRLQPPLIDRRGRRRGSARPPWC